MNALSRALLERIINYSYLLVCDEKEYEKYHLHTIQKAYRKLNRELVLKQGTVNLKFSGEINIDKVPDLRNALKEFTSNKGKEITPWTKSSLLSRIETLGEKTNLNITLFTMATLAIYEDSSEALHGTMYGSTFHLGLFQPGNDIKTEEELRKYFFNNFTMIFWLFGLLLGELIKLINETEKISNIYNKSEEHIKVAIKNMSRITNQ